MLGQRGLPVGLAACGNVWNEEHGPFAGVVRGLCTTASLLLLLLSSSGCSVAIVSHWNRDLVATFLASMGGFDLPPKYCGVGEKVVELPREPRLVDQISPQSCWAATIEMAGASLSTAVSQREVLDVLARRSHADEVKDAIDFIDLVTLKPIKPDPCRDRVLFFEPLDVSNGPQRLAQALRAGRPVVLALKLKREGHAVLAHRASVSRDDSFLGSLDVVDPNPEVAARRKRLSCAQVADGLLAAVAVRVGTEAESTPSSVQHVARAGQCSDVASSAAPAALVITEDAPTRSVNL